MRKQGQQNMVLPLSLLETGSFFFSLQLMDRVSKLTLTAAIFSLQFTLASVIVIENHLLSQANHTIMRPYSYPLIRPTICNCTRLFLNFSPSSCTNLISYIWLEKNSCPHSTRIESFSIRSCHIQSNE